ncbi:MAG: carboxymuconolactone decarboxylase family protein [Anaerolineales bacterium]
MNDEVYEEANQKYQVSVGKVAEFPQFRKRHYSSLKALWQDFRFILKHRSNIKVAIRGEEISKAFQERLMMAVTEVNDCRYCRRFHIHQAFQAGISEVEIQTYLSGIIPGDIPTEQKLAVAYAKHWAENDAQPDPESQSRIQEVYGKQGFEAIEIILHMIRMGNLLGNTGDYILYRLSSGRRGQ